MPGLLRLLFFSLLLSTAAAAQDAGVAAAPAMAPVAAEKTADSALTEPQIPKSEPPELGGDADVGLGWVLVRTLVVLGLVVASAYLVLNVGLRRLMGVKAVGGAAVVDVLERVPLDTKRALFVVKAAGEYLLIGGADASLNLIAKLDTAEVERLRAEAKAASLTLSPLLTKLLAKKPEKAPPKET